MQQQEHEHRDDAHHEHRRGEPSRDVGEHQMAGAFSMFQKPTTSGMAITPVMVLRHAELRKNWPRITCGTKSQPFCCSSRATALRPSRLGAVAHLLRNVSCSSLVGQPNQAFSPFAAWPVNEIGSEKVMPVTVVEKMFQPPSAGGFFTARRDTSAPQSIAARSTLTPAWRSHCAANSPAGLAR